MRAAYAAYAEKAKKIPPFQDFITANGNEYALDFAFYCSAGKMDVETDGDSWHSDPLRIPADNQRDNDLETSGWKLLRFKHKPTERQNGRLLLAHNRQKHSKAWRDFRRTTYPARHPARPKVSLANEPI